MKKSYFFFSLIVGFIIILIGIYGFFLLRTRAGLPTEIDIRYLRKIDDIKIEQENDLEFILSQKIVGEEATFMLERNGRFTQKKANIVPFYSQTPFPLIYLLIGLFSLVISVLVFLLRARDKRARLFYWTSLAFSSSIMISGGFHTLRGEWLTYFPGILFYLLYPLAPALLLHFSLFFSKSKIRINKLVIYIPAIVYASTLEVLFLCSTVKSSIGIYRIYQTFIYAFRYYVIVFFILTVVYLIFSYRKAILAEEQAQIKWIFYGLFVGLGPFILIYQLPQVLRMRPLISEEFTGIFFVFIPLAFAISIVRYKLMNIEFIINRSIVYSILTVLVISTYLLSIRLLQNLFSKLVVTGEMTFSLIGALVAAVVFHPARKKIQQFVDKAFYRQNYDYRKSILSFNERACKIVNQNHLIDFFLLKTKNTLPLEHMSANIYSVASKRHRLLISKGREEDLSSLVPHFINSDKILTLKKSVRTEENVDFSCEYDLEKKNIEMVIPLNFQSFDLIGFLTLGKKKSGERFNREDIELLLTMSRELTINLERIRLQEEVFQERAEKEKLDELNRLKTEFISSVSHEIRTPMSSIQGLIEILQAGKIRDKSKKDELLDLVAKEASHLSRFLHNILDFGKIEQKAKTFNFQNVKIQSLIEGVMKLLQVRLESAGFVLKTNMPQSPLVLRIDQEAVRQVLINIIDNAIQYSSDKKEIEINLIENPNEVTIQVKDRGIGIPEDEKSKIFKGFYRHAEAVLHNPKGVGLGLKIVKHIMDAHKGKIEVESKQKKGSTFSLIFAKL